MICLDEYSLLYDVKKNRIVILLPQTMRTATNTISPVVNRRVDIKEKDLSPVLLITKCVFENPNKEDKE